MVFDLRCEIVRNYVFKHLSLAIIVMSRACRIIRDFILLGSWKNLEEKLIKVGFMFW